MNRWSLEHFLQKDSNYDRLANACLAVALLSALLFERLSKLNWVAGLVGLAAGAIGALAYLARHLSLETQDRNQPNDSRALARRKVAHSESVAINDDEVAEDRKKIESPVLREVYEQEIRKTAERVAVAIQHQVVLLQNWVPGHQRLAWRKSEPLLLNSYLKWMRKDAEAHSKEAIALTFPAANFAENVVAIIERLSGAQKTKCYEYLISPTGGVLIRPMSQGPGSHPSLEDELGHQQVTIAGRGLKPN